MNDLLTDLQAVRDKWFVLKGVGQGERFPFLVDRPSKVKAAYEALQSYVGEGWQVVADPSVTVPLLLMTGDTPVAPIELFDYPLLNDFLPDSFDPDYHPLTLFVAWGLRGFIEVQGDDVVCLDGTWFEDWSEEDVNDWVTMMQHLPQAFAYINMYRGALWANEWDKPGEMEAWQWLKEQYGFADYGDGWFRAMGEQVVEKLHGEWADDLELLVDFDVEKLLEP